MSMDQKQLKALETLALSRARIDINFDAWALYNVVAACQLALRHPELPQTVREMIVGFCEHARDKIAAHSPDVAALIDRGFDAREDSP